MLRIMIQGGFIRILDAGGGAGMLVFGEKKTLLGVILEQKNPFIEEKTPHYNVWGKTPFFGKMDNFRALLGQNSPFSNHPVKQVIPAKIHLVTTIQTK